MNCNKDKSDDRMREKFFYPQDAVHEPGWRIYGIVPCVALLYLWI